MPRVLVRLGIVLSVILVLLVVVDRLGAFLAERAVAGRLTSSEGLARPASVDFTDVPFLTQALRGRYTTVEVTLEGMPTPAGVTVDRIDATLHGVTAPTGSLLRGEWRHLVVDRAEASAVASFATLQDAARRTVGAQLTSLRLARAGADRVAVTARAATSLGTFTIRGQARVATDGGRVTVRLLPETVSGVPSALRDRVTALVDLAWLAPPLPFGFRATAVTVEPSGLRVAATGSKLSIPA